MSSDIALSLQSLEEKLSTLLTRLNRRRDSVTLVGIAKTKPASLVRSAFEAGLTDIGENYVQELTEKRAALSDLAIRWHFVGHLQSRKAKTVAGAVSLIHSLDSLNLAQALAKALPSENIPQDCLVQVNTGEEESKSGLAPAEVFSFLTRLNDFEKIRVRGLMTLPPFFENPENTRPYFKQLRELRDEINRQGCYRTPLTELSMGMSHDFAVALEEGATIIRVGTAIFGERVKN